MKKMNQILLCMISMLAIVMIAAVIRSGKVQNIPYADVTISGQQKTDMAAGGEQDESVKNPIVLDENRVIQNQSFDVDLVTWGSVRFVPYLPGNDVYMEDVSFFLTKENQVVYSFPYYCENNTTENYIGLFDSVAAVGFRDVNHDGLPDVIAVINYVTGAGPQGMMPRGTARIFFAEDSGFVLAEDLMDDIEADMIETEITIASIYTYIEEKESSLTDNTTSEDSLNEVTAESSGSDHPGDTSEKNTDTINSADASVEDHGNEDEGYYSMITDFSKSEVESFAENVRAAVLSRDWEQLSTMMGDSVTINGTIYSAAEFLAIDFSHINEEFITALDGEICKDLFCNWQGIMLGSGEVWISEATNDVGTKELRVIALNSL